MSYKSYRHPNSSFLEFLTHSNAYRNGYIRSIDGCDNINIQYKNIDDSKIYYSDRLDVNKEHSRLLPISYADSQAISIGIPQYFQTASDNNGDRSQDQGCDAATQQCDYDLDGTLYPIFTNNNTDTTQSNSNNENKYLSNHRSLDILMVLMTITFSLLCCMIPPFQKHLANLLK